MGVHRPAGAEGLQHQCLARRVREVVVAADHVRHAHVAVVHRHGEVVERAAVGALDHEVLERREREAHLAADQVLHRDLALVRHPEAHRAVVLVRASPRRAAPRTAAACAGARSAWECGPSSQSSSSQRERVEDLLHVLGRGALAVRVLDAQDEGAARAPGRQPVVQCGARPADVKRPRGGRREPDPHLAFRSDVSMLIGAHVSTAGGLVAAHARGVERGCAAIQVFNQSPRMWRPTSWKDDDIAAFLELMASGPIESVVIHAVYLINCASEDREMRRKSITSLVHALRMGDAIGADGVVLHAGSALKGAKDKALARAGKALSEALAETEGCMLLLEDTAGGGTTLGRSFEELAELIERAGGNGRLGICLDSCHLLASGFDVRTADGLSAGDRRLRVHRRPRPPALPARERLEDEARLEQRPPRPARHRRAGRARLRRIPLRAPLRGAAHLLRGPRLRRKGAREGGHPADEGAAAQRPAIAGSAESLKRSHGAACTAPIETNQRPATDDRPPRRRSTPRRVSQAEPAPALALPRASERPAARGARRGPRERRTPEIELSRSQVELSAPASKNPGFTQSKASL